ncbi:MAG: hypothetical protein KKA73_15575 [Chloroflexi bacterium]|nr:hypothetical protein [Chloroflexota bacterium]
MTVQQLGLFDAPPAAPTLQPTGPTSAAPTCALCKHRAPGSKSPNYCLHHWGRQISDATPVCSEADLDQDCLARLREQEEAQAAARRATEARVQRAQRTAQRAATRRTPTTTTVPPPPGVVLVVRVMPAATPDAPPTVGLTLAKSGRPPVLWQIGAFADAAALIGAALAQCPALLAEPEPEPVPPAPADEDTPAAAEADEDAAEVLLDLEHGLGLDHDTPYLGEEG